jgi:hypothetical protein
MPPENPAVGSRGNNGNRPDVIIFAWEYFMKASAALSEEFYTRGRRITGLASAVVDRFYSQASADAVGNSVARHQS